MKMKKNKKPVKATRWLNLPKALFAAIICTLCLFSFTACPNAQGLHDQPELLVSFEFSGFGDISGTYAIPGNFDGNNAWNNTNADVVMRNGSGVSNEISVTSPNIQFSLVPVNDWNRTWYKAGEAEGNGADGSSGNRNFYIDNLDLNAGTATVVVKMQDGMATPTSTAVTQ